jgi:hypothetical protein
MQIKIHGLQNSFGPGLELIDINMVLSIRCYSTRSHALAPLAAALATS